MSSAAKDRPNILMLLVDQQRFDATSINGLSACRTPHEDSIAEEGANFSRAYTCTGLCTPARSSLLTGRYPHAGGLLNNTHELDALHLELPEGTRTYAQVLSEAEYRTRYVGKWHVGRKKMADAWGYETYVSPAEAVRETHEKHGLKGPFERDDESAYLLPPEKKHPAHARFLGPVEATRPYALAERGIEEITECSKARKEDGRPWHVRVDWQQPHYSHVPCEPYASMYDPKDIEPWPNFADDFAGKPYNARRMVEEWHVKDLPWEEWARLVARYWGCVTAVDDQVGRVLTTLDELGERERTLVVFTTDHGDLTGSHGMFNKGPVMYEEVYHTPMVAKWPGVIAPGTVVNEFVMLQDLCPTVLDAAGCLPPAGSGEPGADPAHSRSLIPLLSGAAPEDWRREVFSAYYGYELGLYEQRMLRTRRFKFIYNVPDRNELYDLERDPHEMNNLIEVPEHAVVRKELARALLAQMEKTGDRIWRWARAILQDHP